MLTDVGAAQGRAAARAAISLLTACPRAGDGRPAGAAAGAGSVRWLGEAGARDRAALPAGWMRRRGAQDWGCGIAGPAAASARPEAARPGARAQRPWSMQHICTALQRSVRRERADLDDLRPPVGSTGRPGRAAAARTPVAAPQPNQPHSGRPGRPYWPVARCDDRSDTGWGAGNRRQEYVWKLGITRMQGCPGLGSPRAVAAATQPVPAQDHRSTPSPTARAAPRPPELLPTPAAASGSRHLSWHLCQTGAGCRRRRHCLCQQAGVTQAHSRQQGGGGGAALQQVVQRTGRHALLAWPVMLQAIKRQGGRRQCQSDPDGPGGGAAWRRVNRPFEADCVVPNPRRPGRCSSPHTQLCLRAAGRRVRAGSVLRSQRGATPPLGKSADSRPDRTSHEARLPRHPPPTPPTHQLPGLICHVICACTASPLAPPLAPTPPRAVRAAPISGSAPFAAEESF